MGRKAMAKKSKQKRGGVPSNSIVAAAEDNTPPPSEAPTHPSGGEEGEKVADSRDSSLKPLGVEESESPDETVVSFSIEDLLALTEPINLDVVVEEPMSLDCPGSNAEAREAEKTVESDSDSKIVMEEGGENGEEKATITVAELEATEEAIGKERTTNGASSNVVEKGDEVEEELKRALNGGGNEGEGEDEGVGNGVDADPQTAITDAGGEDNFADRKTPFGEIEEITEIEEMGVLGKHETRDAKDVDDTVGEGKQSGFSVDEEKDNKEENKIDIEKDVSEDSDRDSDEDDLLCKYSYDFLTNYRKGKNIEIFVGGIGKGTAEEDLINVFGKFGELKSIRIVKHQTTKKSKGFGFIQYATLEQSKNVLSQLKDGIEVRGSRVNLSASQEKDTLFLGNICKKWTKEHVYKTLCGYGIEQNVHIHVPEDDTKEGRIKGFALLEFSSHSDALVALQRLIKPDAVFGRNISAKVYFAEIPIHPSEEAPSKVETNFAKPHFKDQLQKQGTRSGFKVTNDVGKLVEAGSSKEKAGSSVVEARSSKKDGRVNNKGQSNLNNISRGHDIGTPSKQEKKNHKRKNVPTKADDGHGQKDNSHGYDGKSKKKLRGNNIMQGRQNNTSRNPRSYSGASSVSHGNQYALKHANSSSNNYPVRSYTAISRAKIHHTDMEPHAGYLEPTVRQQGQMYAGFREPVHRMQGLPHAEYLKPAVRVLGNHLHDYRMSASGYDDQGSRGPYVVGSGPGPQQSYVANYTGRVAYQAGVSSGRYQYSNIAYPPGRAHSFAKPH